MATLSEIELIVGERPAVMVYFSAPSCGVCHALKPKLVQAINANFPLFEILSVDVSRQPEASSQFGVFATPTVLIFFEGKEFIRKSRNMSVAGLVEEIRRPYEILIGTEHGTE
ncbi:MAG: thioredoxin family protein [Rhodanobacter sp.]|jgi:thiol-disulfide isomerase/thioredoxin|nr:thioredoxin family protein [Rhodanobacter sp.]